MPLHSLPNPYGCSSRPSTPAGGDTGSGPPVPMQLEAQLVEFISMRC